MKRIQIVVVILAGMLGGVLLRDVRVILNTARDMQHKA